MNLLTVDQEMLLLLTTGNACSVKPVVNDHPRDPKFVALLAGALGRR